MLAATHGLRLGELLALRWSDVDIDKATLHVRRTLARVEKGEALFQPPKTRQSNRVVTLSKTASKALKAHRARQNEQRLAAVGWEDHGLVFPDAIGRPQHASNFHRSSWRPVRDAAALAKGFTFHDLRHTAASLALANGVPVATVAEMLGHAKPSITLAIYTHAIPGSQQQAADTMDRVLAGASG